MNEEEYKKYCDMVENMYYAGVISQSTKNCCQNEAYLKNQSYNNFFDNNLKQVALRFKKKFDTSYWATSPEITLNALGSIPSIRSMGTPEIDPKPAESKLGPFSIKSAAARVRWARLRKLNRKLEYAKIDRIESMFQGVF